MAVNEPALAEAYMVNPQQRAQTLQVTDVTILNLANSAGSQPETVVVIAEEPTKTDWKRYFISMCIVLFCASTAVGEQQLSKESNSPDFEAPFFMLWFTCLIRSLTFFAYFPVRLLYERFGPEPRQTPGSGETTAAPLTSESPRGRSAKDLFREAKAVMGPKGFQFKNSIFYLVPFSLSLVAINGLFYFAVTFASVSENVTIGSLFIVIVHIISWLFLKEKFLIFKSLGIAVCIGGVVLTAYASGTSLVSSADSWIAAALMTGSSVSLAVTSVLFKKYLGTPTVNQIALYQSMTSFVNVLITWPLFLSLKLTGAEKWDFATAPWLLLTAQAAISATGAWGYYAGISFASPIFISLSRPLQIIANNGIDIGARGNPFTILNIGATVLVIAGFLMLVIPNNFVDIPVKTMIIRIRSNGKTAAKSNGVDNLALEDTSRCTIARL